MRLIIIFIGIIALLLMLVFGVAALIFWVFAPLVLFGFFGYGLFLILMGFYAFVA